MIDSAALDTVARRRRRARTPNPGLRRDPYLERLSPLRYDVGMTTATAPTTCLDPDPAPGRRAHAWVSTGLDVIGDNLCNTRRCTWCGREEHKPYGAGGTTAWKKSKVR